jgi:hypothetical protein
MRRLPNDGSGVENKGGLLSRIITIRIGVEDALTCSIEQGGANDCH